MMYNFTAVISDSLQKSRNSFSQNRFAKLKSRFLQIFKLILKKKIDFQFLFYVNIQSLMSYVHSAFLANWLFTQLTGTRGSCSEKCSPSDTGGSR